MEIINITHDIRIIYKEAASFPDGVLAAHQQLHTLIPFSKERMYFGISRPESGLIVYKAAAEEKYEGEAEVLQCKSLVLEKGRYVSLTVKDFMKDLQGISHAFNQLLSSPDLDPQAYCVEWYFNDTDVRCMIRLKE
jgi:hypothetical protein